MMKRAIIKWAMKLFERVPSSDDLSLNEIFCHKSFTLASNQERERIMQKSSEFRYLYEYQHPFDSLFGFDLAPLLRGKVVLDLGCFTGGKSVAYTERYRLDTLYGIDIRDVYIEAAQRFAKTKGIKAEFVCATGEKLPFEDEKFDAICSHDVFEHVRDVEQTLSECNRVLKRKGKLFVVFPSYFGPVEHHLSLVTATPFIHYFFDGRDLIDVYNELIDERGQEESYWYKRQNRSLETWERCNTLNGCTKWGFRKLIRHTNWNVYYERNSPLLRGITKKYPALRLIRYLIYPFAQVPFLEEFLCERIIYILETRKIEGNV
ncbi:MAG: class I SAM-dependent methyltransferase [Methanophagales archaeon]|nr:class I SAM-dependent methyltransferase [Methanophagales archaeon]